MRTAAPGAAASSLQAAHRPDLSVCGDDNGGGGGGGDGSVR